MSSSSARTIFDALLAIKAGKSGTTPEQGLLRYCKDVLTDIERMHFDFKEKSNTGDAKLADADKKNLAKGVSGFANSAGGVLIWGLEDGTLTPKPIADGKQFLANLLQLAVTSTEPVVAGIEGDWIPTDGDPRSGFVFLLIPESDHLPHRVALKIAQEQNHYFMRTASSFVVVPHVHLRDMFGGRQQPSLVLSVSYYGNPMHNGLTHETRVTFMLENHGRATAKAPGVSLLVPDGINLGPEPDWYTQSFEGGRKRAIIYFDKSGVIHPRMAHVFSGLRIPRQHLFDKTNPRGFDYLLKCEIYAENMLPTQQDLRLLWDDPE